MKKLLLLLLAFASTLSDAYADHESYKPKPTDDYITISDLEVEPGSEEVYKAKISLVGSKTYTAYEMDIELPPGMTPDFDKDGTPKLALWKGNSTIYPYTEDEDSGNKDFSHMLVKSYDKVGERIIRLSCISLVSAELTAREGVLLTLSLKAGTYLKPGDATLKVTNLHLITNEEIWVDGQQFNGQQYNCKDQTLIVHVKSVSTANVAVSTKNQFGTCVLPFPVDKLPVGLHAYSVSQRSDDGLYAYLEEQTTIRDYTPYILYAENGFSGQFQGDVNQDNYQEVVQDGILYGALVSQKVDDGFVLQNQGSGVKLYSMGGTEFQIPAGRCWVKPDVSGSVGVKALDIRIGDAAGVGATEESGPVTCDAVFTLSGQRVARPLLGGIYIMNGRKVLKVK